MVTLTGIPMLWSVQRSQVLADDQSRLIQNSGMAWGLEGALLWQSSRTRQLIFESKEKAEISGDYEVS